MRRALLFMLFFILSEMSVAARAQSPLRFVAMPPSPVGDTRLPKGLFGSPAIQAQESKDFIIPAGTWNVPNTAAAYSLNVTVVPHGPLVSFSPIIITTSSLPPGTDNTPYSTTLAATGGQAPYIWSVIAGRLPAGLTLDAHTGVISGTPTTVGTSNLTVQVSGSEWPPDAASARLSITVAAAHDIAITASPALLSVVPGNRGISTILTNIMGSFNSAISLSASAMPWGAMVSFNPSTIPAPGAGSSEITIAVGSDTPTGTYPITVTGDGGGIQQNTSLTLTVTAQSPPPNGMIGYSIGRGTSGNWVFNNFQLVAGPTMTDLSTYRGSNNGYTTYVDGCCMLIYDIYPYVLGTAATQVYSDPEGLLLHMNVDYQPSHIYSAIDQFDVYEQPNTQTDGQPWRAVNGIFLLTGSSYVDETVPLYCPTAGIPTDYWSNCANYTPAPVTVSDRLLIGYQVPFDTVNLTLHAPRSGGVVTWQYWNGTSFASLTTVSDTTSGLTTTGAVRFLPPSNWAPHVINGSQSKYWVQITVSGAGTNPSLAKVYGDNLLSACKYGQCARGWSPSACVSGHINVGTPVEYCAIPHSGSTAKFRQQARQLGYGGAYNDFYGNPGNVQNGQPTWAYALAAKTAASLTYSGMNGVMFDNGGWSPSLSNPTWSSTQTELGATTYLNADTAMFQALHMLLTTTYGSDPRWWDGMNWLSSISAGGGSLLTSMNWALSEAGNVTVNSFNLDTSSTGYLCTNTLWCPENTINNPHGTEQIMQVMDNSQFGIHDGNGNSLSNYHRWDMWQRGPMNALAMYYMVKNTNVLFAYDPAGFIYNGSDDYYYWVIGGRLGSPIAASTCTDGCTIILSRPLTGSPSCPNTSTEACPIRIGGADVVGTTSYSGTTLTTQTTGVPGAILSNYPVGTKIEYAVKGHQSIDKPLHTPIAMYGTFIPASAIYLGRPDSTYGFNNPCTSSSFYIDGGCIWKHGPDISGNAAACQTGGSGDGFPLDRWCSPLLRRDFTGGAYGNAIVLLRPVTPKDNPTASTEYDTYSQTITLPGTYYQVMANGTVSSTPITSTTLRGGEAVIYVTPPRTAITAAAPGPRRGGL